MKIIGSLKIQVVRLLVSRQTNEPTNNSSLEIQWNQTIYRPNPLYALDGSVRAILKSTLQAVLYLWYDMRMMQKTLTYSDLLTKGSVSNAVVDRVSDSDLSVESIPLYAGDKLTRAEFERRYEAHPEIKKAELIEGIVYIQPKALWQRNPAALLAVLNEGLASSEHAAFVEQLSRSIE